MPPHDEPRPRLTRRLPALVAVLAAAAAGLLVLQALQFLAGWDLGLRDTPAMLRSTGPTQVQLQRLRQLVSARVHVADVLVGESRWLEGSWIVRGDALLAVDMSAAEVRDVDDGARTAVIMLPRPAVVSPRVNHAMSRQWDIKSRSWIPLAGQLLGDRPALEQRAMAEA
ncbi:MAG: hypothetical protein U0797_31770, partial [Gemmataceae bacterium]